MPKNFYRSLAAVVAGNLVYLLAMQVLPVAARHRPKHLDLGLVIDFWFCLAIYGLLALFSRRQGKSTKQR